MAEDDKKRDKPNACFRQAISIMAPVTEYFSPQMLKIIAENFPSDYGQ